MVTPPGRVRAATEWMDLPRQDTNELARALRDLAWVNRWLGGSRLVCTKLASIVGGLSAPIRLLDVGSGYADIPRAMVRWARCRGLSLEVEGLDHHDQILALASQACQAFPEILIRQGDALALPYPDGSFDIVLASLILHHMEGQEQVALLRELYRVARHTVLVNDLRRGRWPYLITWASLRVASQSRLIHHDGPLSVRRGFLPEELQVLAREAGWARVQVSRHPFFRLALVGEKMKPQMHANGRKSFPEGSGDSS